MGRDIARAAGLATLDISEGTRALVWYEIGRRDGVERLRRLAVRHGRWLTMAPEDLDRAVAWFRRRAGIAVLVGRLVPAVRTLISVPAGMAAMRLSVFVAWTALGAATWTALLAVAGYLLEAGYAQVAEWLNPVTNVIVAAIVLFYAYRVVTFRPAASGGG